jgi:hypothetical protein
MVMTNHVIAESVKKPVIVFGIDLRTAPVVRLEDTSDEWSDRVDGHQY